MASSLATDLAEALRELREIRSDFLDDQLAFTRRKRQLGEATVAQHQARADLAEISAALRSSPAARPA